METMTKRELVDAIQSRLGSRYPLGRQEVVDVVDEWTKLVQETLAAGRRIELRGFGVFTPKTKSTRMGRNPKTGNPVTIPARRVVLFQPGKDFKAKLQESLTTEVQG